MIGRMAPNTPRLDYDLTESIIVTKTHGFTQKVTWVTGGLWKNRRGVEAKWVVFT